ncbi:MAG: ankyrin repeat domain-containing protein [Longimicrobiales bacterium]|nr:ankyrin repeat domain-containing protein [Longimicrobiales bacterium]
MKLRSHGLMAAFATLALWAAVPADSPVADAAMKKNVAQVRALLESGADVNAAQGDGMTALHWAAEHGNAELAEMLLHAGANPAALTRLGDYTPLHLAARGGHGGVVARLLDAGADAEARTSTGGVTPLHFAAGSGSVPAVRALLEAGAEVDVADQARGQTPLMFAASAGRVAVLETLLAAGAEPGVTSTVVDIPAMAAADQAAEQVRNRVLATFRGDQPPGTSWQPTPAEVQAAVAAANAARERIDPAEGDSPSADEADAPDPDLGEIPVTSGERQGEYSNSYADLVYRQGGLTALHHAVREGRAQAAFTLLDGGADIDQPTAGDLTTPMLMAVINGHFDLALDLLDRGADPNLPSHAGLTPLYAAINTHWAPKARYPQQQAYRQQEATHLDVMKAMLEAGADPNVRLKKHLWFMEYTFSQLDVDTRGATPFWRAAYALDLPAMRMLIAYGADPNVPTMKAPERRRGGDRAEADPSGLPPVPVGGPDVYPIHAATGHAYGTGFAGVSHRHAPDSWLPAVRYLVEELGADVNARDANGFSPLHWAASRGDNEVIRYLVEKGADATVVARTGQTTADMANGPVQRISPFPETIALLESLGSKNNNNCQSC